MSLAQAPSTRRGLRVLIVDDHASNRRLVRRILLSAGDPPFECRSGAEALQLLCRHAFDVVLMGICMPGQNEVETVRRLRAGRGPWRTVPVIALTSDVSWSLESYLALGFNGFVSTPLEISELLAAIDHCVSGTPRPRVNAA
jgi:CheY-like chemotaxis protein